MASTAASCVDGKQDLAAPVFVAVQITDAGAPVGTAPSAERPVS
jgi:hypothetical protein